MSNAKQNMARDALIAHQQQMRYQPLTALFRADSQRFHDYSGGAAGLFLDYSKQHINSTTRQLWHDWLVASDFTAWREHLFSGGVVNLSEDRPAWHVGLRDVDNRWSLPCHTELMENWARIRDLASRPLKKIIHVGIGGSEYGPRLLCEVFSAQSIAGRSVVFLSSETPQAVEKVLSRCDPKETIVIIASKSFSTVETLRLGRQCRDWLTAALGDKASQHIFAVTAEKESALQFGVEAQGVFALWDAVGGRFSATSSVSLVFALLVGFETFCALLRGAHEMDRHFHSADALENLPVLHALSTTWYTHFWNHTSRVLLTYHQAFKQLVPFVQQLCMESLGKRVDAQGMALASPCGPMIWGGVGSNTQHTFHQFLFQGNRPVGVDFVLPVDDTFHATNCLAQSQALMVGHHNGLTPHQEILGNVPSTTLLFDAHSPEALGALIALYEHSVFVQSVLLGVNAFDQWGVELGKSMARRLTEQERGISTNQQDDQESSTQGLMELIRKITTKRKEPCH